MVCSYFRHHAICVDIKDVGRRNTKTNVVVGVVRVVPVAVRTAGIPVIVIERAAAQNTIPLDAPFTTGYSSRK